MAAEKTIEIQELVLRVPGVDRSEASTLAEEVARNLADQLPNFRLLGLPHALDLRITIPREASPSELPQLIATQIARSLR